MALIFMPRKSALIILLVLGTMCLVDGIAKKDSKEILMALAILGYAIVSLVTNLANKNDRERSNSVNPNR